LRLQTGTVCFGCDLFGFKLALFALDLTSSASKFKLALIALGLTFAASNWQCLLWV
jgi:hypothetical protein